MKLNNSLKSLMALALVVGLAACDTPAQSSPSTHEHTFAEEWSKDETHHWHEATCEHADAVEKVEHAWGEGEVTKQPTEEAKGEKTFTCVCGATKVEEMDVLPHTHKFADEWSKDETHHWKASTCGHAEEEVKVEHTYGEPVEVVEGLTGTRTWTCECGYEKVEAITNLVVNYKLPNGEVFKSETQEVKQGEAYSIASPKVNFMAPSIETVEGTMGAEGVSVDVTYDYSAAAMEKEVAHGQDFGKLYVDPAKGLSLSYVMKGSQADWDQVFRGDTYAIYNGCIRAREAFPAMVYAGDWYDGSNAVNGAPWNALLSSDTEEILVTWSINPDGSVSVYKNGGKVFQFNADVVANGQWAPEGTEQANPKVSNFVENMLLEVANVGLKVGAYRDETLEAVKWSMRDLSVNYAMDDAAAAEYAAQYKVVKGVYVDSASNTPIRNPYVSVSKIGSTYAIPAFEVPGYTATAETVTGEVTAETAEAKITYTRNGEEKLTESVTRDRRNEGGWNDPSYWVNMATLTEGSVVTVEYIVNANNNNVDAWKCPIVVVYDTNNNANRCTHRFDWFGWEDGEMAASQNNGSMWCGSMEEYYAVAQDCTVRVTYQLVGGNLTETYTITANSGAYAGNSYFWHPSVSGIVAESVTVALAPEFAQVILTSVYY